VLTLRDRCGHPPPLSRPAQDFPLRPSENGWSANSNSRTRWWRGIPTTAPRQVFCKAGVGSRRGRPRRPNTRPDWFPPSERSVLRLAVSAAPRSDSASLLQRRTTGPDEDAPSQTQLALLAHNTELRQSPGRDGLDTRARRRSVAKSASGPLGPTPLN
jgi:hypothetical protein